MASWQRRTPHALPPSAGCGRLSAGRSLRWDGILLASELVFLGLDGRQGCPGAWRKAETHGCLLHSAGRAMGGDGVVLAGSSSQAPPAAFVWWSFGAKWIESMPLG